MVNINSIITEIAEGIKDSNRGKKQIQIPISWIKDSIRNEGIRWNNKYMNTLLEELKKLFKDARVEEYKTHIINKQQKNDNYSIIIEC